ncbi:MAG: type II secretion system GspH family protein [Phycisphaerales bacterium]|nr:type II secretion system GspH family protein [Phycisphaerales bacterium]
MPKRVQPKSREGVTIVELLVVIAVISVLIALVMPSLQSAREQGSLARVTARLRHLGIATVAYSGEHRDSFPHLGVPGSPWEGLRIGGSRLDTGYYQSQGPGYFTQSLYYANLFVPCYFEVRDDLLGEEGVWLPTWNDAHFITPFVLSGTAFAAPRYWEGEDTPDDPSLYRAVRLTEAVFPSSKGLILHLLSGAFDPRKPAGTVNVYHALAVDGAAGPRPMPTEEELDANSVSRPYGSSPQVISSTLGGMAGRDF